MRLPSVRQLKQKYVLLTDIYADFGVCVEMEGYIAPRDESQRFVVPVKDLKPVDRFPNYADDVDVWERLMRTSQDDMVTGAIEALALEKRHDLVSLILLPKASKYIVTSAPVFKRVSRYTLKENAQYSDKRNTIVVALIGQTHVTIKRNGTRERLPIDDLVDEINQGQYVEQTLMTKALEGSIRELLIPFLGMLMTGVIVSYIARRIAG